MSQDRKPPGPPKSGNDLLNIHEVAAIFRVSFRTLQTWRQRGGGPPFVRLTSRSTRYRRDEVEKFAAERQRRSTSDYGDEE